MNHINKRRKQLNQIAENVAALSAAEMELRGSIEEFLLHDVGSELQQDIYLCNEICHIYFGCDLEALRVDTQPVEVA